MTGLLETLRKVAASSADDRKVLALTVEEAYALLAMCLASPLEFDAYSMGAVDKLTDYCIELDKGSDGGLKPMGP